MSKRLQVFKVRGLTVAVACMIGVGGLHGAESSSPVLGHLESKDGTLFARRKPDSDWQAVSAKGAIHAEEMLVGLPGAVVSIGEGAVGLTLLTDLAGNSPYPILESAVVLHASTKYDVDFTLDRGRVDITNLKKRGEAHVRIRFHDQQWEATLTEPGTRLALQLYGRWAKGVPFRKQPGPKHEPAADLLLLVRKGQVELTHGLCSHLMSAPPGPALLHWDNSGGSEEAPQKLDKPPEWAATEQADNERALLLTKNIEKLRHKILQSSPRDAARAMVNSEDANERRVGVVTLGALDDLDGLGEVFTATKYPDVWDYAVVVVRHWLGRKRGQDRILYQHLLEKRGYKPAQAAGVMQLLHSFGETDLAHPELYTTLVRYLDNDVLGIRGLAHWHLVRLVPAGKDISFNPLDPKEQRDKALAQWKKRIDDLMAKGELPPKSQAK